MKLSSVVVGVGLGAVLSLGVGACAGRQQVAEVEAQPSASLSDYYPLAVGNRWTYRVNGRDDRTVDVEVLKEEDGYFHDNQGGQLTVDGFGIRDRKRYLLRGPLSEGNSWTNVVSVSSTERYRILQAGVPCEAPAGAFAHCVRVEARNRVDASTTLINAITFAEGVGLVRIEVSAEKANGERLPQTWLELASFKLQGPSH
jgi:hypothetical protein